MPVAKQEPLAARRGFEAYQWNPIIEWDVEAVWAAIASEGLEPHEAYTRYSMTRVSCRWCIMSSAGDAYNASLDEAGHPLYRQMVDLEIDSTFAFSKQQMARDVNPALLSPETLDRLALAKQVSLRRKALEAAIPKHLLYSKGWPTCIPTFEEATLLAEIRSEVAAGVKLTIKCSTPESIIQRYEELMEQMRLKGGVAADEGESVIQLIPALQIQPHQLSFF